MNNFHWSSLVLLSVCMYFVESRNLPSFIKPCKRNDQNLEKCVIQLIDGIRQNLMKGIPELRIPPLDPFEVPMVTLDQGSGSVNFKATFKNIIAYGAKSFNLTSIKIDFDAPKLAIDIYFPVLKIISDYTINGNVLVVPIKGNGKCVGNFSNIETKVEFQGKYDMKSGKKFLKIKDRKVIINMGGMKINFSNLFNGNKQLSDSTNTFINENWRDIIQEINPLIQDTVAEVMVQIIKGFLDLYSLDDLFPEN